MNYSAQAVIFVVQDEGPGIPPEDLTRIFDKYYRGVQAENELPGSGLGLAVVKSIVEAHDGKITAENNPEKGVKFIVTLPPASS